MCTIIIPSILNVFSEINETHIVLRPHKKCVNHNYKTRVYLIKNINV